jgi:EAL domain-containing protein (putative c-di-GMP-specific phosphodiesterase class I)
MCVGDRMLATRDFQEATRDLSIATALTERMLGLIASDIRAWTDCGLEIDHVAINLCSADVHGGQIADQVRSTIVAAAVPANKIVLELDESAYVGQRDHAVDHQLRFLRRQGLRIALDNFGIGVASLTRLVTAPIDIVKLDRRLVGRLATDRVSQAVIEGLLHISREMRVQVVAEGVETEEQAKLLAAAGCTFGQGYWFCPPVSAEDATKLLIDQARSQSRSPAPRVRSKSG